MENATKALLLAAGVLIAIALIGIGISLLSSTSDTTDQVKTSLSAQEMITYNSQFTQYEGTQRGSAVKALVRLIRNNNTTDSNYIRSLIEIDYFEDGTHIKHIDIDAESQEYSNLIQLIKVTANYNIKVEMNQMGYPEFVVISKK